MGRIIRPGAIAAFAVMAIWAVSLLSPATGVRLLANTVFAMGGASNPAGLDMDRQLDGYVSGALGTAFAGYEFHAVPWSASFFSLGFVGLPYDLSQAEGLLALDRAISGVEVGSKTVVVGYSASAGVVTKQLMALQERRDQGLSAPSPGDMSFITIGSPNRPNGGILSRLDGAFIPLPFGATFDGAMPETDYQVLDISWEYDPISDFPVHPFNLLADLNAAVAFLTRHALYYDADPTDSAAVLSDVTSGNTRYLTLKREHLPLLEPLYALRFLDPILDAVEPVLRYVVDLAYDRTSSPAVPTPMQWTPVKRDPTRVLDGFVKALGGETTPVPPPISAAPAAVTPEPASSDDLDRPSGIDDRHHPARDPGSLTKGIAGPGRIDRTVGHSRGKPAPAKETGDAAADAA